MTHITHAHSPDAEPASMATDFRQTRAQLEGLEAAPGQHWWHEVIEDIRRDEGLDRAA